MHVTICIHIHVSIDLCHNSYRFAWQLIFLAQLHDGEQRSCVKILVDDYKTSIVEHCSVATVMWSWEMAAKIGAWVYYACRCRTSASRSMRQLCMTLTITFACGLTLTRSASLTPSPTPRAAAKSACLRASPRPNITELISYLATLHEPKRLTVIKIILSNYKC